MSKREAISAKESSNTKKQRKGEEDTHKEVYLTLKKYNKLNKMLNDLQEAYCNESLKASQYLSSLSAVRRIVEDPNDMDWETRKKQIQLYMYGYDEVKRFLDNEAVVQKAIREMTIDISDLDRVELLYGLWSQKKTADVIMQHGYKPPLFCDILANGAVLKHIDYFQGRAIKCDLSNDTVYVKWYNHETRPGMFQEIIENIRNKKSIGTEPRNTIDGRVLRHEDVHSRYISNK